MSGEAHIAHVAQVSGARAAPWIFSRRRDLLAFGGSALASLVLIGVGIPLGLVAGSSSGSSNDGGAVDAAALTETPEWAWLVCVVLVDVAHVWGNLLLVYADPTELRRRPALYAGVPIAGLAIGVALASEGELVFWRALAALAVIHFVRQQVGWVKLYRRRAGDDDVARAAARAGGDDDRAIRRGSSTGRTDARALDLSRVIDEGAVYAATLAPIVWWHASLPRPFSWLIAGDFFVRVPAWVGTAALVVEVVALVAYAAQSVRAWRDARGNPGKDIVVASTALLWWLGIVALESDYAFTVTNVLIHGVPYMMLIAVVAQRRARDGAPLALPLRPAARFGFVAVIVVLAACALIEEGAWDRLLWHERAWLFPLPVVDTSQLRWLCVPLLALPQLTHYILDGFLWRRRDNQFF